jgi:uncharacterized 2Fe-2S/4Fe-4S cluster protein (DUF4445 family)
MDKVKVVFKPSGRSAAVPPGTNLLQLITNLELNFQLHCGGKGKCGKCKVIVEDGGKSLSPYSDTELSYLSPQERDEGYRLACAVSLPEIPRFVVRIPRAARSHKARLQVEGFPISVTPDPMVKKYPVRIPQAMLKDGQADEDRLLTALKERHGLDGHLTYEGAMELSSAIESGEGVVTAVVWDDRVVTSVEPGDTGDKCLGFAADIGTTKLAGFLIDLNTGKQLASSSLVNPQALYGEDVMSRITFSMEGKNNLGTLQKGVIGGINRLIRDCCRRAGMNPRWVYEGCFVGNTCMTHLLLGLSPKTLALFPYHPVLRRGLNLEAEKLRLVMHPGARVYVLPVIAGFVGADNVAVQLSVNGVRSEKVRMVLDIGTNTEVVLTDSQGSLVCSCASGPAFEGMHVTYGRKADFGSIETIKIDPRTLEVSFRTIGNIKPVGICGSGIIDAIAEMLKAGVIQPNGKMHEQSADRTPRMRKGASGEPEFVIAWKEETAINTDIVITQGDINEIQKAKAAAHAGCTLLMAQKGVNEGDIDELIIAGAFGQYMDKESARTIGMFPEIPLDRIRDVGNAAGTGARLALISRQERQKAEHISETVGYYELATDPNFTKEYASSMFFPYIDSSRYPETRNSLPFSD